MSEAEKIAKAYMWCQSNSVDIAFYKYGKRDVVRLHTTDKHGKWVGVDAYSLVEAVSLMQKKVGG